MWKFLVFEETWIHRYREWSSRKDYDELLDHEDEDPEPSEYPEAAGGTRY
jgi:hypothetical protein